MPTRPFFPRLVPLAALLMAAACADLPTSSEGGNVAPAPDGNEAVALSLDEVATQASLSGDAAAANDFADGALALRLGAVPTEIAVNVGGQDYRYWAVAIGIVERAPDGAELLKRSVIAWTGSG
jgi:hypothetical protein